MMKINKNSNLWFSFQTYLKQISRTNGQKRPLTSIRTWIHVQMPAIMCKRVNLSLDFFMTKAGKSRKNVAKISYIHLELWFHVKFRGQIRLIFSISLTQICLNAPKTLYFLCKRVNLSLDFYMTKVGRSQ